MAVYNLVTDGLVKDGHVGSKKTVFLLMGLNLIDKIEKNNAKNNELFNAVFFTWD